MKLKSIREIYRDIFKSYGGVTLEKHIQNMRALDVLLPHSATFFCITNTHKLSFEYVSKNLPISLGFDSDMLKEKGMNFFWSRIHPDDQQPWLNALKGLMVYTLGEIPVEDRLRMNYTWNYRLKNKNDEYVNIIQNTTPLELDGDHKPIIGLAHYTALNANMKLDVCASAKQLNQNGEYETKYYNNYSQKLIEQDISNRERDIIRLLILKKSSREIAEKLFISPHTVDTHRRNIIKKLKLTSTAELASYFKHNGIY
ncbi:LuxR C-terminal-related transcriptional regulator [Spongiivirga citrea]|uniref:LuxR family transcriptional regulator n=1 Tax=Spongiivirga citrea TaxID=1481457 RepID=A0A6M0CUB2_9FLAO|nr:LuxR C-terminal-related transcriptional regulator [Spongiivirga citrea]NER17360.1 LuxR family transcriptional regulator [Spongiivirga citrea]